MKKLLSMVLASIMLLTPVIDVNAADQVAVVDEFTGLTRSPVPEKAPNGSHPVFTNFWINDGNIQVVKGRDRLNSTANADIVVNGFFYYENGAGTTTKLIVRESDDLVSYDTDGTNRTVLASSLTNESVNFSQFGDILYIQSQTDGLYKWTGSGSATVVGSVTTPSTVDFSASSTSGGLTPGLDGNVICTDDANTDNNGTGTSNILISGITVACTGSGVAPYSISACDPDACGFRPPSGPSCTGSTANGVFVINPTTSTYKYKVTCYSTLLGIETEASTEDSVTLTGDDTVSFTCSSSSEDQVVTSGADTSTTGTLVACSAPFNTVRGYRTVSSGNEFYKAFEQSSGAITDGKPDAALDISLDTSIDTIPPPSYKYIENYKGTLFTAENQSIRFSRVGVNIPSVSDTDKYWLNSDEIVLGSKKPITGLKTTSDSLLIFTETDTYEVNGFGATSFRLSQLLKGIGTTADATVEENESADIIFFAGTQGVYKFRVRNQDIVEGTGNTAVQPSKVDLVKISSPALDSIFDGTDDLIDLDPSQYPNSHAYYDLNNHLYFLYIGQHCFIYNETNNSWSYIPATQMIASLYRKTSSDSGQGITIDNVGFFFNNFKGYENGIESGTVTGTATSSGNTTITQSTATFNTTGDGLKGLWIYLDNEVGEYRQISSNTATTITVSSAWTVNPVSGSDKYYVAYIIPELRTKFYQLPEAKIPNKAIIKKFWLINNLAESEQKLTFFSLENKSETATNICTLGDECIVSSGETDDLSESKIHVISSPLRHEWIQFGLIGFVYNISNTIDSPIDIISYAFKGDTEPLQ
ncbi:MAG: hypothetical protein ACHQ1D_00795 [Nitrososphaerales archaeon]